VTPLFPFKNDYLLSPLIPASVRHLKQQYIQLSFPDLFDLRSRIPVFLRGGWGDDVLAAFSFSSLCFSLVFLWQLDLNIAWLSLSGFLRFTTTWFFVFYHFAWGYLDSLLRNPARFSATSAALQIPGRCLSLFFFTPPQ